jgi:Cytochrome P450
VRGHLQEIENSAESERQTKEEFVKTTLGSMYIGMASYSPMCHVHGTDLRWHLSAGSGSVGGLNSRKSCILIVDAYNSIKTIATISLFLALALHPQVQKRVQAEIDGVVGKDQLPAFNDRPCLPYIEVMCREVLRSWVVTPIVLMILHQCWEVGGAICHF